MVFIGRFLVHLQRARLGYLEVNHISTRSWLVKYGLGVEFRNGILFRVPYSPVMKRILILQILLLLIAFQNSPAIQAPTALLSLAGDQSVVLHWDRITNASLGGYRVYRSTSGAGGPFSLLNSSLLAGPGYCDVSLQV